ncbi:putative aquaporin NIP5-1 isoform X2 [Nicotiana tabacum]|uniref:Aquaporin NIP5-1 isoform X2 n=2 Tax=Nicotiana TaxID=4085 RepID=A0A1S4BWB5_TOBAC|nr:PREDICTED: probable aquaporin NIP5-1 isoform X1 [Nicotiana tabacum]
MQVLAFGCSNMGHSSHVSFRLPRTRCLPHSQELIVILPTSTSNQEVVSSSLPKSKVRSSWREGCRGSIWKQPLYPRVGLGAEFVGTFILIFAATAGPIVNQKYNGAESLIGNAACSGLAVMIVILSTGHISGAHLNPSLTIAFAALRHFPWVQVPAYVAAQVSASVCASFALKGVFHPFMSGGVTVPSVNTGQAFALEFLITFNLLFVVTAVATDTRAVGELAGIAVGATVMLNILVAGPSSGASMNPVRTLGPAVAAGNYKSLWIYIVAPTLGALAGAAVYTLVKLRGDDSSETPRQVRSFRR